MNLLQLTTWRCQGLPFLLAVSLTSAVPAADMAAFKMDVDTVDRRIGGNDSIAGIGDWFLSNGLLCASVSAAEHETGLSLGGGSLVDLGHCGRADDQLTYSHLLPQMEQRRILPVIAISASSTANDAVITIERGDGKLQSFTRYRMDRAMPQRLAISTRLRRIAAGDDLSLLGQSWLHPGRTLTPFSIDTRGLTEAPGFKYPSFSRADRTEALQAMHYSDLTVLVGEGGEQPGISYGVHSEPSYLVDAAGQKRALSQFTLVEKGYTNQIWMTRPLWFGGKGNPGRLEMLQSLFMDLEVGETLHIKQSIYVGRQADVASATNLIYGGHWLRGSLDSPSGRVAVFDRHNRPLAEARVDQQGNFGIRLPKGIEDCIVELTTPWSPARRFALALEGSDQHLSMLASGAPGWLLLPSGIPLHLVIVGREGTPDPRLGAQVPRFGFGDAQIPGAAQSNTIALTGLAHDPTSIALAPGRYRVYASRGPEYGVAAQDVDVLAGSRIELGFSAPPQALEISGWVSADFHVHSGYSFDSALAPTQRLASFVAQGADLLVASDHDYVADLGSLSRDLGMDSMLTVLSGVEVTGMAQSNSVPGTLGHVSLYPWPRDAQAFAGGTPAHEGMRLRELMAEVRGRPDPPLVQLNHPRGVSVRRQDLGFFEHLSVGERYDRRLPLNNVQNRSLIDVDETSGLRDLDFDTYEIASGAERRLYQLARADWLALILQGEYRPALASSDSHDLRNPVAMPRSYVAYNGSRQHPLDTRQVLQAVRAGKVFGTTGPLPDIALRAEDGRAVGIGGTISGRSFTLQVSARAAPWVNVNQLWVYVNGRVVEGSAYSVGELREIPIEVDHDSFIFVEFFGEAGEIYQALAPGFQPMAFTNPVWIDADADGHWQAPGLVVLPMAISDPESLPGKLPGSP